MRGRIALLVLALLALVPAPAYALAGGATGSGGGGGGGGGFSGGGGGFYNGGSGGSGGRPGSTVAAIAITLGVILFVVLLQLFLQRRRKSAGGGFQGSKSVRRQARTRAEKAEDTAHAAQADDGYWDPAVLRQRVHDVFFPVQSTWSKRDASGSRPYVSDELYKRHTLQLEGLERQHRVNKIEDLQLQEVDIVRVINVSDDDKDRFVAFVQCSARDWMEDADTGRVVNGNRAAPTTFQQFWTFTRDPHNGWVLDEIQQAEEGAYHLGKADIDSDDGSPRPAARA